MDFTWVPKAMMPADGSFLTGQMAVGIIVFLVAMFSYRHTRRAFLQKNAIDCQRHILCYADVKASLLMLRARRAAQVSGQAVRSWSEVADDSSSDDCLSVTTLLNSFEDVAVGVRLGVFDEPVILAMLHGLFMRVFSITFEFIEIRREVNPKAYAELCWLWVRWRARDDRLDPARVKRLKLAEAALSRALSDTR